MRRIFLVLIASLLMFICLPSPEAKAIDPVTIAILAPIALKVAETARPYVIRGLASGGRHMLTMGVDVFEVLLLPLGFLQVTLLVPFGQLGPGLKNIFVGMFAPCKLALHALILPVAFFGIGVN